MIHIYDLPLLLICLLFVLIINFVIWGLLFLIFFRKDKNIFNLRNFLITLTFITVLVFVTGFISQAITNTIQGQDYFYFSDTFLILQQFLINFALMLILYWLICKRYLKADRIKSFFVSLILDILTVIPSYIIALQFLGEGFRLG